MPIPIAAVVALDTRNIMMDKLNSVPELGDLYRLAGL